MLNHHQVIIFQAVVVRRYLVNNRPLTSNVAIN